jgi:hypothetical protein
MAEIIQVPKIEVSATMKFSEVELRALDALVKAGALILAEIERLDRAALSASQSTVGDGGAA